MSSTNVTEIQLISGDLISDSELLADRIINYILTAVGLSTTIFRIWDRVYYPNRRFKGDDIAAIVCTIFQLMFLVLCNMYMHNPANQDPKLRIGLHITVLILIQSVTWSAKIILSLNLLRIMNLPGKLRKFLVASSFVFAAIWPMLAALNIWECMRQPVWYQVPQPTCIPGMAFVITELITNVLADIILTVVPIWYLWGVGLNQAYKIRVTVVFLTFAIMTADVLNHEYWVVVNKRPQEELASVLHAGVLLIVANLIVVIPFFFRTLCSQDRAPLVLSRGLSNTRFQAPVPTMINLEPGMDSISVELDGVKDFLSIESSPKIADNHSLSPNNGCDSGQDNSEIV